MNGNDASTSLTAHDLFLIELRTGEHVQYLVTERILTVNPDESAMGVPWSELAALFRGNTLRAVPLPGRSRARSAMDEPGVSTFVEVNLVKIEKGG